MSGDRLLLDTNAIVALLGGNQQVVQLTRNAQWIGISIISEIEFLCFGGLTQPDRDLFAQFRDKVEIVSLSQGEAGLIDRVIDIRRRFGVKLPDAIIAATALVRSARLVTADRQLANIADVSIASF
jgi:tRNA(fMet)-specific endonuclease VapC